MFALLGSQDVWKIIQNGYEAPKIRHHCHNMRRKKNQQVLTLIRQCLDESMFVKATNATTTKEAQEILQSSLQSVNKVKKGSTLNITRNFEILFYYENFLLGI
ncbi:hypothetical protein ERO13_D04G006000v2 [Gossypium hirsutum]|nr:hypothetical protein ERO13_D04G006000v2 [Gossypium hirsutum]